MAQDAATVADTPQAQTQSQTHIITEESDGLATQPASVMDLPHKLQGPRDNIEGLATQPASDRDAEHLAKASSESDPKLVPEVEPDSKPKEQLHAQQPKSPTVSTGTVPADDRNSELQPADPQPSGPTVSTGNDAPNGEAAAALFDHLDEELRTGDNLLMTQSPSLDAEEADEFEQAAPAKEPEAAPAVVEESVATPPISSAHHQQPIKEPSSSPVLSDVQSSAAPLDEVRRVAALADSDSDSDIAVPMDAISVEEDDAVAEESEPTKPTEANQGDVEKLEKASASDGTDDLLSRIELLIKEQT